VPHYHQQDANPSGNVDVIDSFGHVCEVSTLNCTSEQCKPDNRPWLVCTQKLSDG
jgi:hypothetical protein